ncbi:MAG TPA: nucleotide exchange factor GrpE [Polyangia bacterium]
MSQEEQEGRDGDGADKGARAGNGTAADGPGGAAPSTDAERVAALTAERDEIKDRMLRIAAEFENSKKRARKEQEDAENKVREQVLRDMLDVIDNLERAVGAYGEGGAGATAPAPQDPAAVLKGVGLVLRLFQSKLERYNVKPIAARGQPFDPRVHEAISRVETAEVPPGAVAVELQRGYRIGERLLRPAMVSVATAPAAGGGGKAGGPDGGGA